MSDKYLAIDIGGTNLKYGLLDRSGQLLEHDKEATPSSNLDDFWQAVRAIIAKYQGQIRGVAFDAPGKIDLKTCTVHFGGALPFLDGLNVASRVHEDFPDLAVAIENDGKAAALAEYWMGNLAGKKNCAALILGTGVGGGIILNGQLLHGTHFQASELSFMLAARDQPTMNGAVCSAVGMIRQVNEACGAEDLTDGLSAFAKINAGDAQATEIFDRYCSDLAKMVLNIQSVVDLSDYVFGGGISAQSALLPGIQRQYDQLVKSSPIIEKTLTKPRFALAKFGNDANLYGAVYNLLLATR